MNTAKATLSTIGTVLLFLFSNIAWGDITTVTIGNNFFSPATVNIDIGDTVRWIHTGGVISHTTTANNGAWNSGTMTGGDTFYSSSQFLFDTAGSYPYFCSFHIGMTGTVNVNGPNVAPSLTVPGPQSVLVPGQSVSFMVSATDANPQDTITITLLGLNPIPASTTPSFTGTNPKSFNWSPICEEAGNYYAKFQASDGKGGLDVDSVLITVQCTIHYIKMLDIKFVPQTETVGLGEQVCWVHEDTLCPSPCFHSTVSDSGVWDSDTMFTNDTFCFVFNNPGVYPYHCEPHSIDNMVGTILVCEALAGDANASGNYTLGDVISIVNYVFNKPGCTPQPLCWLSNLLCRGDWNASGNVTLSDVIQAVNFVFNKPGGPWNAMPIGVCCFSL